MWRSFQQNQSAEKQFNTSEIFTNIISPIKWLPSRLKKIFEASPGKSTIVVNGKCSDCGCEATIDITITSEGFGLQVGVLFKCSPDGYLTKCPECF